MSDTTESGVKMSEDIFVYQLIGFIIIGTLAGELDKTVDERATFNFTLFISNILSGGFLAFLFSYAVYLYGDLGEKRIIWLLGGGLGFLGHEFTEQYLIGFAKKFLTGELFSAVKDLYEKENNND